MHIYVVDAAGEGAGFTPTGPLGEDPSDAADTGPVWSPDGAKIAFTSDRTGVWQIYVMDADGANVERVTNSLGPDQDPSWSPDGRSLAFVSERDGNREIYKIGIDGTGETRLTNNSGMDYNPAWYR
jgi:Tol biopolymer transport system component